MNTVASLPAKWRADAAFYLRAGEGDKSVAYERCADKLEAALASPAPSAGVGVDDTRVEFERWVSKRHGCGTERWADSGKYRYDNTNAWWECWCAALQHPAATSVSPAVEGDAGELPDSIRVPLDELHADAAYLIGRVQADGSFGAAAIECIRQKIDAAKVAIRLATTEQPGSAVQGDAKWPQFVKDECLEVLRNIDTQLRATGQQSARLERLINLIGGLPTTPPPAPAADHIADAGKKVEARGVEGMYALEDAWLARANELDDQGDADGCILIGDCAREIRQLADSLNTPNPVRAEQPEGKWKLPCDVRLPPATTIRAGCNLSTLIHAMESRKEWGVVHFPPKVRKEDSNGN